MLTKPQDKPPTAQEKQGRQELKAVIGQHVMRALGKPGGLLMVQVRPLWEDRYRANVFVGVDVASAKVAHSYFLVVNSDGNIIASTPKITKQY